MRTLDARMQEKVRVARSLFLVGARYAASSRSLQQSPVSIRYSRRSHAGHERIDLYSHHVASNPRLTFALCLAPVGPTREETGTARLPQLIQELVEGGVVRAVDVVHHLMQHSAQHAVEVEEAGLVRRVTQSYQDALRVALPIAAAVQSLQAPQST